MKIAFLLSDITNIGGIERVTTMLATEFSKYQDVEVDIISLFRGREKINYPIPNTINNIYITKKPNARKPHSILRIVSLLKNVKYIKNHFDTHQYDYIIAQSFPIVFILSLCKKDLSNVFAVEHVHCRYYNKLIEYVRNKVYSRVKNIVVLTKSDKYFFDLYFSSDKTIIIPNPCDIVVKHKSKLLNKSIISIGRLEYQKGYDTLIKVFKRINKEYPDWCLNIYGDGSLRNKLYTQIMQNNLSEVIKLCGTTNDINGHLRESSFYVMSSRFEGFGMVLVEALSQGVPCVSFNCPNGPSDIIQNYKNGILVEDQNEKALYDAIKYMIEHPEERKIMGEYAVNSIDKFSTQYIVPMWINLFSNNM